MKLRGIAVCFAVLAICLVLPQAASAAATATLKWEVQTGGYGSGQRAIAVDSTGSVYVPDPPHATVLKYSKDGALLMTIGPEIKDSGGNTGFTIINAQPRGMAIDPKTGYLFIGYAGTNVAVVDVSGASAVYLRSFGLSSSEGMAIKNDGSKLFAADSAGGTTVTQYNRNDNGTPTNYTDDTFVSSGVTFAGVNQSRYCAVDSAGRVYVTNIHSYNVQRYNADGTGLLTLVTSGGWGALTYGCAVDNNDLFWIAGGLGKVISAFGGDGLVWFSFDNIALGGHLGETDMVAYDKVNHRLILAGSDAANVKAYVSSWEIVGDIPGPITNGTIAGRVVDSGGTLIADSVTIDVYPSPGEDGGTKTVVFPNGNFSVGMPPGVYTAKATVLGYISSDVTHYTVTSGSTTTTADIPLLPDTTDYVKITLGAHNVEQGLYNGIYVPWGVSGINFASTQGGRACRGWGRPEDGVGGVDFWLNVDDNFMYNAGAGANTWIEIDWFDDGPGRWQLGFDGANSMWSTLGWVLKNGSNTWKTSMFYTPFARFANVQHGFDMVYEVFSTAPWLDPLPQNTTYLSSVKVYKSEPASAYTPVATISELKTKYYIGSHDMAVWLGDGGPAVSLDSSVKGKIVTWSGPSFFYIEEEDRSAGIRVVSTASPAVGTKVDIAGSLGQTDGEELCLLAYSVVPLAGDPVDLAPVSSNNRSLGGSQLTLPWTVGATTYNLPAEPGVTGGYGTCNVGLLVRAYGRVTSVTEPDLLGNYAFYIDDGSGVVGDTGTLGVKVACDPSTAITVPAVNDYVSVTGAASLGRDGATHYPQVIPKDVKVETHLP